jgi:hypothetical protein
MEPVETLDVEQAIQTNTRLSKRLELFYKAKVVVFFLTLIFSVGYVIIKCTTTDTTMTEAVGDIKKLTELLSPIRNTEHGGTATAYAYNGTVPQNITSIQ